MILWWIESAGLKLVFIGILLWSRETRRIIIKICLKIIKSNFFFGLLIFVAFVILRWLPEKNIGQYPIGFDPVTAYPSYFQSHLSWPEVIFHYNFLPWLLVKTAVITGWGDWLILKIWACLLYGLVVTSFFIYALYGLKLKRSAAVLITIIFGLSLSMLRVSVDLYRNEIGLIFLFLFMGILLNIRPFSASKILLLFLTGFLAFFAHQLTSVLVVVILFSYFMGFLLSYKNYLVQLIALAIMGAVLIVTPAVVNYFSVWQGQSWWKFYLSPDIANSTPYVVDSSLITSHFIYLYGWFLLLLVALGLLTKRNNFQIVLLLSLLFLSFSPIIYGGYGLILWDRWMYFLIIPLAYFGYYGLSWLALKLGKLLSVELIIAIGLVILVWRPAAYLVSGENSQVQRLIIPDERLGQYIPGAMAENSLGEFNKTENRGFFNWLNSKIPAGVPVVLDHSIAAFAQKEGLKAPIIETFYNQLTPQQKTDFRAPNLEFYTINQYGLNNLTEVYHYGSIKVYKKQSISL